MKSARLTLCRAVLFVLPWHAYGDASTDYATALVDWAQVLETFVDEQGRTDFVSLAASPQPLVNFVAAIGAYGPATDPAAFESQAAVLAYHINSYNALAMHGVIDEGRPENFDSFFKRAGFFKFRKVMIDGATTNLYDYENKVIRPLGEPRVHFALNCMVRDCPRLPQTAFVAESLDAQLEQLTREFINSDKHVMVDDAKQQVLVSAIFDFYTKDFVASGKTRDLPTYINRYREPPLPNGYKVKYLRYDWTVNQQPDY